MEMQRYFLHLRYKGTNYCGWQTQPNGPSVQGEIEKALTQLNSNNEVKITGCGRTDTGVHATNYFAHVDLAANTDGDLLLHKLNGMLQSDIAILKVHKVANEAHARFDATARTYHYFIHAENDPFVQDRSWYFSRKLNVDEMNKACLLLHDHRNFECFSKVNTDVNNFECIIGHAEWIQTEKALLFTITSNRFLRNMVRAIVGTMVDVGLGKMTLDGFSQVLESRNRSDAGMSVPAKGLFLADVRYPFELA